MVCLVHLEGVTLLLFLFFLVALIANGMVGGKTNERRVSEGTGIRALWRECGCGGSGGGGRAGDSGGVVDETRQGKLERDERAGGGGKVERGNDPKGEARETDPNHPEPPLPNRDRSRTHVHVK